MKISELTDKIIAFREARDWKQFHTLKDLCIGLNVEVAELQEHFLWKTQSELASLSSSKRKELAHELADIFIFLAYLSNDLQIDLEKAIKEKITINSKKYPLNKSKGNNKKYTQL